jgi:cell filamentation protein
MTDYFADSPLENKLGIRNPRELKVAEEKLVAERSATILMAELPDQFDESYFKSIHKTLFGDIYDFAGSYRTVNMIHPENSVPFAQADFLHAESERIFRELPDSGQLQSMQYKEFAQQLVKLSSELNALHPFRDGNGRTIRLFLIVLSLSVGYLLDYSEVDVQAIVEADKKAFEGDETQLELLYEKILKKL